MNFNVAFSKAGFPFPLYETPAAADLDRLSESPVPCTYFHAPWMALQLHLSGLLLVR